MPTLDIGANGQNVIVHDLRTGISATVCGYDVERYVITDAGKVACGGHDDSAWISVEGLVIDEGPGVDPSSLTRRGDTLVWLHDGVERTAPLP